MYRILIADDEALEREVLVYLLKQYDEKIFDIVEAKNGVEALEQCREHTPDVMLLDIQMPGHSGLEVLEQARKMGYQGKAIFLTAYDQFDYAVKALKLRAKDFIVKPIAEDAFINAIDEAVEELLEEKLQREMEEKRKALLNTMEGTFAKKAAMGNIDEEIMTFFEIQGFSYEVTGNCICMKMQYDTTEDEKKVNKKMERELVEAVRKYLTELGYFVLVNLQNDMAFLIYINQEFADTNHKNDTNVTNKQTSEKLQDKARETTEQDERIAVWIRNYLEKQNISYIMGMGNGFDDLSSIEESYACAREQMGDIREKKNQNREVSQEETLVPKELTLVKNYLEENFANKITLESLAALAGFTKYYLSRLYKKHYHENIMDCLIRIRMEKAKEILCTGERNVQKISDAVGYTDPNYFTWSFKKYVGETPMKFWQRCQES